MSWAATRIARHEQAVANTLRWARQAADDGDFADALGWVRVLESIGEPLSDEDKARRDAWRVGLEAEPPMLRGAGSGRAADLG
jgi:hypothetical protein